MLECRETGLIYRNPKPYLRAVNAWHPHLVVFDDGEILATFDLGQGPESMDYRRYQARSTDNGRTWSEPTTMFDDPVQPTVHSPRPTLLRDGTLVAMGPRMYRPDPEQGLINRETFGFTRMDLILLRSRDRGRTWEGPEVVEPPLVGPAFEGCHNIVELEDGRWLYPTCTWRGWDGEAPNGMKAIALVSHDRGRTWLEYIVELDGYDQGVIYFEQSFVQLDKGRLLVVAWSFHEPSGTSRPNAFALAGETLQFGRPQPTGLNGETAKVLPLEANRVLCLYRRTDEPGLWGVVATVETDHWDLVEQVPLWQGADSRMFGKGAKGDELSNLKLGYPNMVKLPDGDILGTFWCCEDEVYNIRWLRLAAS